MLQGYISRLHKQDHKLCRKFGSKSALQGTIPIASNPHHSLRFIQSLGTRSIHCTTTTSTSSISPFASSHAGTSSTAFHASRRHFSLPAHEVIGLPALSPSVEESKIVEWKKKEGDMVEADDAIASVQTDKAELDWQVTDDVYLAKILLAAGEQVPIGTPACIFVEEAQDVAAFKEYQVGATVSSAPPTPPPTTAAAAPPISSGNYPEHNVEGMPALSPTATDGAVVEWLVKEGDKVEEGTGIAEIQTDKSVVTWTSTDEAFVAKLLVPVSPDTKLAVGTPLAVFVEDVKDVSAFKDYVPGTAAAVDTSAPSSTSSGAASPPPSDTTFVSGTGPGGRVAASPYARKKARELGIALDAVGGGSGPRGRIVVDDVVAASKTSTASATGTVTETASAGSSGKIAMPTASFVSDRSYEDIAVSAMREIIGKRLSESKFSAPHFYVTMECEMDSLLRARQEMNADEDIKISVNDFVIKACAAALRATPDCNVSWVVDKTQAQKPKTILRKFNYVDISVAVATPSGLITPIIKDADRKSLSEISGEMKELANRAKLNKLAPDEFQGGTFTISNMGMYGVTNFTAIINPPQSCILAVGGAKQRLVPDAKAPNGFRTATMMQVTLSSDHRAVDGAVAAQW
eukprot:CAMPEP_0202691624 /NCGR_PEP_ID=MMETSP1385-20130828/6287_1 /ASSEMBLY_ACC=CAM_ASM_000861 /TAXON_ID=933848 /ORGANISM="Elphidium margaritaceum" /LENGTH=631 /DNA_ID=CAMNT_0049347057 /DNA_START=34 /DNA_END=1926 /DNA_ORIENTATION=-